MVVYNYLGKKILSEKTSHICTRFYNNLHSFGKKYKFLFPADLKRTQNPLLDVNSEFES